MLKNIERLVSAQNEGDLLLVQISEALNEGELPSSEGIESLYGAVTAMLAEVDPQQRLYVLQRKLGLLNPEGRPRADTIPANQEENQKKARTYWINRFMGESKTKARLLTAESHGCSIDTIKRRVKEFPLVAKRTYSMWPDDMRPKRLPTKSSCC